MSTRHIWEDIYALEIFPDNYPLSSILGVEAPVFDGNATHGVLGVAYGTPGVAGTAFYGVVYNLLPTDHSALKAQSALLEKDVVTGSSIDNSVSLTPVTKKPENITIPLVWNQYALGNMFTLFFQGGCSFSDDGVNTQTLNIVPYTDSKPMRFGNVIRFMQDTGEFDAVDQVLKGVIVKKLTLKGEEGGIIDGDVEFMPGAFIQGSYAGTAGQRLTLCKTFDNTRPLKFEKVTIELGGDTIFVPKFDLTFENNAFSHFYNNNKAEIVSLGKLELTGSLTVPWNDSSAQGKNKQITDFIDGVTKTINFTFKDANLNPDPDVQIIFTAKITDYTQNDIDGLPMLEIKFKLIDDPAASGDPLLIQVDVDNTKQAWIPNNKVDTFTFQFHNDQSGYLNNVTVSIDVKVGSLVIGNISDVLDSGGTIAFNYGLYPGVPTSFVVTCSCAGYITTDPTSYLAAELTAGVTINMEIDH